VTAAAHSFDLGSLQLEPGQGRRLDLTVPIEPLRFGGERYSVVPPSLVVSLDVSCTTGPGWALRVRFTAVLEGPCMRCLDPAAPAVVVDAREVDQPAGGEELSSPYLDEQVLDLAALARDSLVLAIPPQLVCSSDCAGLCAVCGINLNHAGPDHQHERPPDPRWAKLRELRLE